MVEVNEARRGDSARETIELIEKAMEGVTPGPWTVDDERDDYEIAIVGRPTWKCTRFGVEGEWDVAQIEIINDRDAETQANAAYIAACSPDRMREVVAAAREAEALKREIADLREKIGYWQRGHERIEECLADAVKADPLDAPIPLIGVEAKRWHAYRAEAFRHALEMMGIPEAFRARSLLSKERADAN